MDLSVPTNHYKVVRKDHVKDVNVSIKPNVVFTIFYLFQKF